MSKAEEYLRERFGREIKKYSQLEIFAIQEAMQSFADEQNEVEVDTILKLKAKLKEADEQNKELRKALYFVSKLGIEGAKRQTLEEIGNSDSEKEKEFYYKVLGILNQKQ